MAYSDRDTQRTSLRHLELFESVGRLQSFRRAAAECNLSQPAVTLAISRIEDQLGAALLERRSNGAYLNSLGEIFHRRVTRLFRQIERALTELGAPDARQILSAVAGRLSPSQIQTLFAIVDHGSIANAVEPRGISIAHMHRAAKDLERALRLPLFVESALGTTPSLPTVDFARKLKVALKEVDAGVAEVGIASGKFEGSILVGSMLMSGNPALTSVINHFARKYTDAQVKLFSGSADDMLRALRCGQLDFVLGLVREPASDDLAIQPLAETPFHVAAGREHPLAGASTITEEALCSQDWVLASSLPRRNRLNALFPDTRPNIRVETCSLATIKQLLVGHNYLSLLSSYELRQEADSLVALPYRDTGSPSRIGLTMRRNWSPTPLQGEFIDHVGYSVRASLLESADKFVKFDTHVARKVRDGRKAATNAS